MIEVPWEEFGDAATGHGAVNRYGRWYPALFANGEGWMYHLDHEAAPGTRRWMPMSPYLIGRHYVNVGWQRLLTEAGYSLPEAQSDRARRA